MAQMYEGQIKFIESTLFGLIAKVAAGTRHSSVPPPESSPKNAQSSRQKSHMKRVLIGDARVNENSTAETHQFVTLSYRRF